MPAVIKSIDRRSPAARARLKPGDKLISINGKSIEDVLDYKYHGYEAKLVLEIERDGKPRRVILRKQEGQDPGIDFEDYLMDKPRACSNRCVFCFVDQLPRGMRRTLYFKDDDARLSFLQGNYITLTNLSEHDLERLISLRISPINISVHATEPELRAKLLGNPRGAMGYEIMQRLAAAGITMNCQIVCCPGLNDGQALARSMRDLEALWPYVPSVSIVPVGLTKHRERLFPLTPFEKDTARETIALVDSFGEECLKKHHSRIFMCSDELYLKAELPIPDEDYYEDYPQLENGVGLMRLLETEFKEAAKSIPADCAPFCVITGVSAGGFIRRLLDQAGLGDKCTVYSVVNDFFGHTIDVAGLVTGQDIIKQLQGKDMRGRALIPAVMLRQHEGVFLDDVTLDQLSQALGVPVIPTVMDGQGLANAIMGIQPEKPAYMR